MKSILIIIFALILFNVGFSQNWISLNSGTTNNLNSICFLDTNIGFAIGDYGTILKTINGGDIWTTQNSGTTNKLTSVCFVNSDTGFIVGWKGTILKTTDGGLNWISQYSDTSVSFIDIFVLNTDTIFITGNSYSLYKSVDGGLNWNTTTIPRSGPIWAFNSNNIYLACSNDQIYNTIDGGLNWTSQVYGAASGYFFDICFVNLSDGIAVGGGWSQGIYRNFIRYTKNKGVEWFSSSYNTYNTDHCLKSVCFINDSIAYVVGLNGLIIKTQDGGASWTTLNSVTTKNLNDIYFTNSNTGFIVGSDGIILKTNNNIGIYENEFNNQTIKIYPNPVLDYLIIELDKSFNHKETFLSIFNSAGQKILEKQLNTYKMYLSLNKLIPGIYYLRIFSSENSYEIEFLKE